jgi:hypothetical protein
MIYPGICPVCLAAECGAGYSDRQGRMTFTCLPDLSLAERVHRASANGLMHRFEAESLRAAGATAGQWLMEQGETDIAKLSTATWETFLGIFRKSFADQMRMRLAPKTS